MIGDAEIDQKSEITLLGVTLDDQLTYSSHISKVCRKASCQTGVLLRLRNLIPTSAKLHIVKFAIVTHLTSILSDCLAFLSCFRYQKIRANPRKSVTRSVYCDNVSSYEELLQRASLPTLYTRRLQDIAIMMFKVKNGLAPPYITDLFVVSSSHNNLKNSDFIIPRFRTVAYGKRSLSGVPRPCPMVKTRKIYSAV